MVLEMIPFVVLATIAILSGVAMITSRNAIHSALFLVINFGTIAVFYLVLNAPFLAMVQVAVYAGAIMVLFLFVIMLLGAERLELDNAYAWQRPAAIILAMLLLAEGGYLLIRSVGDQPGIRETLLDSSPHAVGIRLFNDYLFPFEVTSVLLLVAMIGAIVLTLEKERPA